MSEQSLGFPPSPPTNDVIAVDANAVSTPRRRATDRIVEAPGALMRFEQEQLARELADIERASAALRLGEPALRSWIRPAAAPAAKKPRPLWLLIGILWLSTAVITVGAVAAIATLAG